MPGKTIAAILLAGSMALSSCSVQFAVGDTLEDENYRERQQEAEIEEIMKNVHYSIDESYQIVDDYLARAEKELEETQQQIELIITEMEGPKKEYKEE